MSATSDQIIKANSQSKNGVLCGFFAYLVWGSFPAFFKLLPAASPLEIVCHRIVWSAVFLLLLVLCQHQLGVLLATLAQGRVLIALCCSTVLIATNWFVFMLAVQGGEILQSSLGYFINPLLSALLGYAFLGERLSSWQYLSFLSAFAGVLYMIIGYGQVPWISLLLATSFGLYGLLRKVAKIDALIGLTVETLLLAPVAVGYLVYLSITGEALFLSGSTSYNLLLPLAGVITAVPLLLFIVAARRLKLTTLGFMQYITPSLHFVLAVLVFCEPFSRDQLISFVLIWIGLAIYSFDVMRGRVQGHS